MKALRSLLLGDTWTLPFGIAITTGLTILVGDVGADREAAAVALGGALVTVVVGVSRSARVR